MKSTIYYFSGTGNSMVVAQKTASLLGESDLVPIASLKDIPGDIHAPSGRVGIICPVYDMGVPVIVGHFLSRLVISSEVPVFAILTLGGTGGAALRMIDRCVRDKNGRGLNAGFLVKMPSNFPPLSPPPTGAKRDAILARADREIAGICSLIRENTVQRIGLYPISSLLQAVLYGGFSKGVHLADEKMLVSDACTSCEICASVCPAGNITIEEGRPVFHHQCELCCACLNYCPTQAIDLQILFGSKGRGRYHHPEVTISDMKKQKESYS